MSKNRLALLVIIGFVVLVIASIILSIYLSSRDKRGIENLSIQLVDNASYDRLVVTGNGLYAIKGGSLYQYNPSSSQFELKFAAEGTLFINPEGTAFAVRRVTNSTVTIYNQSFQPTKTISARFFGWVTGGQYLYTAPLVLPINQHTDLIDTISEQIILGTTASTATRPVGSVSLPGAVLAADSNSALIISNINNSQQLIQLNFQTKSQAKVLEAANPTFGRANNFQSVLAQQDVNNNTSKVQLITIQGVVSTLEVFGDLGRFAMVDPTTIYQISSSENAKTSIGKYNFSNSQVQEKYFIDYHLNQPNSFVFYKDSFYISTSGGIIKTSSIDMDKK